MTDTDKQKDGEGNNSGRLVEKKFTENNNSNGEAQSSKSPKNEEGFEESDLHSKKKSGKNDQATFFVKDNKCKETDHTFNAHEQKLDQNQNVKNEFEETLSKFGLDEEYWANRFKEKLGITKKAQLQHLTSKDIKKLKPFRFDWEERALKKLVPASRNETTGEKTTGNQTFTDAQSAIKDGTKSFEETVQEKLGSIRSAMNVKDNDWVGQKATGDLKQALSSLEVGKTVEKSTFPTTQPAAIDVIEQASGGLALMGVHLHNMSGDVTLRKKNVIQVCGEITMKGPLLQQKEEFLDITSREKTDNFQKSLETTCKNAKFSLNIGVKYIRLQVRGSGESLNDSDHTHTGHADAFFQSREKHVFVPLKSCELKRENVRLIPEAIKDIQTIEREYRTESDCSTNFTLCVNLFEKFGSHVGLGMLHFGGIYKWIATYTSKKKTDNDTVQNIVQDVLEGFLSVGISQRLLIDIAAGVSGKYLNSEKSIGKKYSEDELSKTLVKIEPDPPFEGDFQKWKETLKSQSAMFSMIARDEFCGLWCLLENHHSDFRDYKKLADILECVWSFEMFKSSLDKKDVSNYIAFLKILSKSLLQLNKVTDVKIYFSDLVQRDDNIQDFLESIADSTKQQKETEKQEMRKILGTVLIPLKNVFLPERPKLVKWIAKQIENMEDFPSVLSTDDINDIHTFLYVLKSKFLPQIRTQESNKQFITKELSHICKKLLGILRCSDTREQFLVLMISLQRFRYDDENGGFPRLLDISDIEMLEQEIQFYQTI